MMTEAKIKHLPLDLTQFKALVESLERLNLTALCEQGHNLIAEHIRNRRLLEAGERLERKIQKMRAHPYIGRARNDTLRECCDEVDAALAAYQEAAK